MTLLYQSYLAKHLKPVVSPSSKEKGKAHSLFRLTITNDKQLPINMFIELDVNFLGLKVPYVEFLITKDPNCILNNMFQAKMSGVVSSNLIRLAFTKLVAKYGISESDSF